MADGNNDVVCVIPVQALQKEGAKALRIDQAGSQHGPIELQEEDNYVMCK